MILIADDNTETRELLAIRLRQEGYEVAEASDGLNAMAVVGANYRDGKKFEAFILDCAMPNLTGTHVASRLKELKDPGKVFFITAHPKAMYVEDVKTYDVVDVFEKPINIDVLLSSLKEALK